ncbi:hypothetical protein BD324DRAFT_626623 [Kockovaella imperatae]|uniref:NADH:ubiquinone oxidoreductase 20.1kD subunit n=1 Tax=Kockovaella imperatae TaxID=4999 RepID=A0A1Y1UEY4_9TREE|nr:hypothetical protein BD324DRAFT_626623 [Kockovaella imperatae]ORX36631.1 hypothetical protein BD324DRAFT_626623 [Kockovaella imperatae]
MYKTAALRSITSALRTPGVLNVSSRSAVTGLRFASTRRPVPGSSGTPASEDAAFSRLQPGEEIDPQLQGYPQLPYVFTQERPAKGWWDRQNRRNFGEVLHEENDMLGIFGPDKPAVSSLRATLQILTATACVALIGYIGTKIMPERSAVPRQYPYNGLEKEYGGGAYHPNPETHEDDDEE